MARVHGETADALVVLGGIASSVINAAGDLTLFSGRTFAWMVRRRLRRDTLLPIMHSIGVRSVPVVAITGTFIGMVLAVQSYSQFHQLGLDTQLGGIINLSIVRELGPVLAATMLAGRVGSAMAAELATMRVTEQIDALSCLGVNPLHYLVVPRFLACMLLIPLLTIMANFMGVMGGADLYEGLPRRGVSLLETRPGLGGDVGSDHRADQADVFWRGDRTDQLPPRL